MINLNLITDCESELDLLNSLFKVSLVSASTTRGLSEQYLIYQVSTRSYREVNNCAFFILSSVISSVVHITFTKNQNCYVSSLPMPFKIGIFIAFAMLNGGGGGGVDEGVCGGGGGGGGVEGSFTQGIP